MWCEKRLREKINRLHEMDKTWRRINQRFSNFFKFFFKFSSDKLFSPRILIFLNAKNQAKKSESDVDNQRIGCFWFFEGWFSLFRKKIPPNTWLRIFNIVFLPTETQKNIFGDYLKISQNNPWKTWQPLFKCGIFANGKTSQCTALNSFLHRISSLLIFTHILPLPR